MSQKNAREIMRSIIVPLFVSLMLLSGCGSKVPVKEDVLLQLTFIADPDINPGPRGRPSPLAVRVFELRSTDSFQEADYFVLLTNPAKALETTLLPGNEKFIIRPGGREIIRRRAHPETAALGIVAGYRDMNGHVWQLVHPVPPPPDAGMFSSPERIVLEIRLHETDMQLIPGKP